MDHLDAQTLPYSEVRTIYFGAHWGDRHLHQAGRVPTPVGKDCYLCTEKIADGDQGLIKAVARLDDRGEPVGAIEPVHAECDMFVRIGHLVEVCPCHGFKMNRDSARIAWQRARLEGLHPR